MRPALLVLALVISVIGGAVFAASRLIDDQAIERHLIARIEDGVGRPIVIRGPVDLGLLPRPRLTLRKVGLERREVGDEALGIEIEQLELGIGIAGLLRGEVEVHEALVVDPTIELGGGDLIPRLDAAIAGLARLDPGVATVSVRNATIIWNHGRTTDPVEIRRFDLELVSSAQTGVIGVGGQGKLGEEDLQVEIETRRTSTAAPVKLVMVTGQGAAATRAAYRGFVTAAGELDGNLELSGSTERLRDQLAGLGYLEPVGLAAPDVSFALRSKLELRQSSLELADLRIATGGGELDGSLTWRADATPQLAVALQSRQLTLDQSVDPRHLALLWQPWNGGIQAHLALRIGALAHGGEQLRLVRLEAEADPGGGIEIKRLTADLPGSGDIEVTARLVPAAEGATWQGRIVGALQEPAPVRRWLGLGDELAWADGRQGLALRGDFRLSPTAAELADAELRLDTMRATGGLVLTSQPRPSLRITGKIERPELDGLLMDPRATLAALHRWLVDDGASVEAELALERVAWRDLRLESVTLRARADSEQLQLDELVATDHGGARLVAKGVLPWQQHPVSLDLEARAGSLGRLARLLPTSLPLALPSEGEAVLLAKLRGSAEGAAIDASLEAPQLKSRLGGRVGFEDGLVPLDVAVELEVPSLFALSPNLAVGAPGEDGIRGTVRVKRRDPTTFDIGLDLAQDGGRHRAELALTTGGERPRIAGKIEIVPLPVQAIPRLYRLAEMPLGLLPGPISGWPGNWPATILALDRLAETDLDLELGAELVQSGTALGRATVHLAVADRRLLIDGVDLPLAGGRLGGEIVLDPKFGTPAVGMTLRARQIDPSLLALDMLGASSAGLLALPPTEPVDVTLVADSVGNSLQEILGNLEGRVTIGGLDEPWPLRRGVASIRPPLRWELDGEDHELGGFLDPTAWIMELDLLRPAPEGGKERLRLLGPPERLRQVETPAEAVRP